MQNSIANVTANANLPAQLANLGNALITEGSSRSGGMDTDLLKFLSREGGVWVYGQEGIDVEPESTWAVNPLSFQHGWVCWKDSKIAGEAMAPVGQPKPMVDTLPDNGVDAKGKQTTWDEQMSIRLMCVSGEDEGVEVIYKVSTVGGLNAIKDLAKAVGAKINSGSADVVAVVTLANDSYPHKEYGKTYIPVLDIASWMGMDAAPAAAPAEAADEGADDTPVEEDEAPEPPQAERKEAAPTRQGRTSQMKKPAEPEPEQRRRRRSSRG